MLRFKGQGTIKEIQERKRQEEKKEKEAGIWVCVVPRAYFTEAGWIPQQGSWYSPGRNTSNGYHFHVTTNGEKRGFVIVTAVYYTNAQNVALGGGLNREMNITFDWSDQDRRLVVGLANQGDMNGIHPNQRPYLQGLLAAAMIMPLDHLD